MALLAALGGGGDDDAGDGTTTSTSTVSGEQVPLTKSEYVRRGDAICEDMYSKYQAIPEPEKDDRGARVADLYDQEVVVFRNGFAQLRALRPPASDQVLADQLNANADQIVAHLSSASTAARAERNKAYNTALDAYNASVDRFSAVARQIGFQGRCTNMGA